MSFYPCFWPVLLLTSSGRCGLDGVELLKKWAICAGWSPGVKHVDEDDLAKREVTDNLVGRNAPPFSKGVHFLDTLWMYCATGSFWRTIGTAKHKLQ